MPRTFGKFVLAALARAQLYLSRLIHLAGQYLFKYWIQYRYRTVRRLVFSKYGN
jgi:hypothetical protein